MVSRWTGPTMHASRNRMAINRSPINRFVLRDQPGHQSPTNHPGARPVDSLAWVVTAGLPGLNGDQLSVLTASTSCCSASDNGSSLNVNSLTVARPKGFRHRSAVNEVLDWIPTTHRLGQRFQ